MRYSGINPDSDTITHTLKACASAGDVVTAHNLLEVMKKYKIEPNVYIYN